MSIASTSIDWAVRSRMASFSSLPGAVVVVDAEVLSVVPVWVSCFFLAEPQPTSTAEPSDRGPADREEGAPAGHAEQVGLGLVAHARVAVEHPLEHLAEAGHLTGAFAVDLSQLAANVVAVDVHVSRAPWKGRAQLAA